MCRLSLEFVTTPHATQFYPEEMPEHNILVFFTPQRRVSWDRTVSLQKRLLALLLRDLFTINI
jgi:hypothetical protein